DKLRHHRFLESLNEHFPIHVFSNRKAKECENGWRYIEQCCPVDALVFLNVVSLHAEDAIRGMLVCRTCRFIRQFIWPKMIRMKTMVAHKYNSHIGASQLQQSFQHHIMKPVDAAHGIFVHFVKMIRYTFPPRRMKFHEGMAVMIDGIMIYGN